MLQVVEKKKKDKNGWGHSSILAKINFKVNYIFTVMK
jgi:hypothetical protein